MKSITALTILCTLLLPSTALAGGQKPAILIVSGWSLNRLIDEKYKSKMESEGYVLDSCRFESLTWDRISKFNAVVIERTPYTTDEAGYAYFAAAFPLLRRFMDEGGGVLWLYDGWYNLIIHSGNKFTSDYGLEILPEYIWDSDPAHKFKQSYYREQEFIKTRRVTPHPCTQGVDEVWIPGYSYNTSPVKVSDDWQVLVTGEESAYSHNPETGAKTYDTRPPILEVRKVSNGRMAFFSVMSAFTVQAGYHRSYEGLLLDQGGGYRIIRNTCDWLAEPSLSSGSLGGFAGPGSATAGAEQCLYNPIPMDQQTAKQRLYTGLIGARSEIAGGSDSVSDMCRAAREAGLSFLVFTEPMSKMNRVLWEKLVSQCKEASWGDFVAIPGFEYREPDGSTRICYNNADWVADDIIDENGFFYHPDKPLFSLNWPTIGYVDSHHPNWSTNSYHIARFYSAFGLFSYDVTTQIDDSVERFKTLTADLYWVRPLSYHKICSVSDIVSVAGSDTYKTSVLAPSIREVPESMRRQMREHPFGNSCFVSNGPKINDFRLVGEEWNLDPWENYFLWEAGDKGRFSIDVSSDVPLTDVIVYRGTEPYWHFRPNERDFTVELDYVFECGGNLWMEARDANDRRAYSCSLMTRHNTWWSQMCADLQNTLQFGMYPTEKSGMAFRDGRRVPCGGMGWQMMTCSTSMPGPAGVEELIPDGLDACYMSYLLTTSVSIWSDGTCVAPRTSRMAFVHQTGAASIMDSRGDSMVTDGPGLHGFYAPKSIADSKDFVYVSRTIASPGRMNECDTQVVEQTVTFLRDFTVSEAPAGELAINLLSIGSNRCAMPDFKGPFYRHVSYNSDGNIMRIDRKEMAGPVLAKLDKFGGVCIYPNYYGSGAVFSLDGSEYDLMITRDDVFIGLNQAGRKFKKGETLTARFLVIHEFGIDRDDAGMRDFASSYGIGASPAYRIAASTEVNQDFYPTILTQDYGAEVRIGKTDLANDLFLKVVGLNPNWSAGCYDSDEKSLVVQGVLEGAAYVPVDTRRARNLYVGNVLVCDWPDVRLTLLKSGPSGIEFQAHNPTNTAVTTVIKSPGAKAGLVELKHELSLKPGEIRVVTVKDN